MTNRSIPGPENEVTGGISPVPESRDDLADLASKMREAVVRSGIT
jgi:hypothetical protein